MKVLLTGAAGQLGQALIDSRPEGVELIPTSRSGGDGLIGLDLADAQACSAAVEQYRPDWVLNGGAYTAVDKAESEPELAQAVNAGAPRAFAEALSRTGGSLLQLSTDFVFNGRQGSPYRPDQQRDPLGVYGATKAAGEEAVDQVLGGSGRAVILRTSWVYGPVGQNFLRTMLRLHATRAVSGDPLTVVADQVGCPTATTGVHGLAAACWRTITQTASRSTDMPPILHWSDAGVASWYDFALAIGELGVELGALKQAAMVLPIRADEYPTPAVRPHYSLLDCSTTHKALVLRPLHWRAALACVLGVVSHQVRQQSSSVSRC